MCGIAGIIFRDGQRPVLQSDLGAMAAALRHRGPDDEGTLIHQSLGLTMRRLSVIDVAGGRQPIWNEDRTVGVVQNGEIYNFLDLRADLLRRQHRFATASDTETLVHLYEEIGPTPHLPSRLHGMFAFALFDRARMILVLARDRAGKKPLYIYRDPAVLLFASETRALFAPSLPLDRALDPSAVDAFLALQYVPGPGTVFRRVRSLPPGSMLVLERTASGWAERAERRYWTLPRRPVGDGVVWRTFRQAVDGCEALLIDAVTRRLLSDVPLGAFLSGGVDSSLIAAIMARRGEGRVRTFSIGFAEKRLDETAAAEAVARRLGTEHRSLRMPAPRADDLQVILGRLDQPLGDPAVLPTWHLSRLARQQVTVALSGEGADEVFGGYHWYRRSHRRDASHRGEQESPDIRRALMAPALRDAIGDPAAREAAAAPEDHAAPDGRGGPASGESPPDPASTRRGAAGIAALQAVDFVTWMPDDLLVKVDRMSMAHSLEVRCPYLDHRLVEAVLPGPDRFKIRWGRRKALLRAVARRYLPREVVLRKKHGFQVPVDSLLRSELRDLLGDLTRPATLARQGLLDPGGVAALLERWRNEPGLARAVWKILCLQVWLERKPGAIA